jgi:hypothetical protein
MSTSSNHHVIKLLQLFISGVASAMMPRWEQRLNVLGN